MGGITTHGVNDASAVADKHFSSNPKGIEADFPVFLVNDWDGDRTCIKNWNQASKGQLWIPGSQLHGKDRESCLALIDEVLEDRIGIVFAKAPESHSHYTVFAVTEFLAKYRSRAKSLSGGNETDDADGIIV
jgi:hypothetical protein